MLKRFRYTQRKEKSKHINKMEILHHGLFTNFYAKNKKKVKTLETLALISSLYIFSNASKEESINVL